jgi:hypothetical protein
MHTTKTPSHRSARALRDDLDLDDDAMTEQTSVTDDDILHDAFSFLNRTGSESKAAEASDEDEIVWDLRHACSMSPCSRTRTDSNGITETRRCRL